MIAYSLPALHAAYAMLHNAVRACSSFIVRGGFACCQTYKEHANFTTVDLPSSLSHLESYIHKIPIADSLLIVHRRHRKFELIIVSPEAESQSAARRSRAVRVSLSREQVNRLFVN